MFCFNCGKQIPDGANFCSGCGAKQILAAPAAPKKPLFTKDFDLSFKKLDKENFPVVNQWLLDNAIDIQNISFETYFQQTWRGRLQTATSRIIIKYTEADVPYRFQIGYVAESLRNPSFQQVEEMMRGWAVANTDKSIVYTLEKAFQYDGYHTKKLYFIYKALPDNIRNICERVSNQKWLL